MTTTILPTNNQAWGFWGTIGQPDHGRTAAKPGRWR